ncbi:MAG: hypothetical protein JKY37_34250 [Nannocystaceae bacterium]|nr:hypothetical protein [Nannocystaceae bacterium]
MHASPPRTVRLAAFAALIGCGGDPIQLETSTQDAGSATGSTGVPVDSATSQGATSDAAGTGADTPDVTGIGDSDSDGGDPGSPIKLDLAAVTDVPNFVPMCGEVDFLFVIDNSIGMEEAQAKLRAAAPAFIANVAAELDSVDRFHVAVITSDAYAANAPGCNGLGDFVTQTNAGECNFVEGHRFATEADNLTEALLCMTAVGTTGSSAERPVTAAIDALDGAISRDLCNAGFIGEDAVVVVVLLTDDIPSDLELDDANLNDPSAPGWGLALSSAVEVNGGTSTAVGLVPWGDTKCTGGESPNLVAFVDSFAIRGDLGSVCAADYGPLFDQATQTAVTECLRIHDPCWPSGCPSD